MSNHLNPLDQLFFINYELMKHGDKFSSPIVTVGGQAVHYWATWYINYYETLPPEEFITSNDVDLTARRVDINEISTALEVPVEFNDGNPPSLAVLPLTNIKTGRIKSHKNKLFVNKTLFDINNEEVANIIDILSSASYLEPKDFEGKKLNLNTETFLLPLEGFEYTPHEKIRVLNPIACMASRFHNVTTGVKKNITQELERIKALMTPVVVFLIEKFANEEFREARKYYERFIDMASKSEYRRFIVTHNIKIIKILEILLTELPNSPLFDEKHKVFLGKDLPITIERLKLKYIKKSHQIHRESIRLK